MSAFGRKNGAAGMSPGSRPTFGVAKPMKAGDARPGVKPAPVNGGEQFPPLPGEGPAPHSPTGGKPGQGDAMARLAERTNSVVDGTPQNDGIEATVHKIKEQLLPRLLERSL